ncbi:MAG: cyanophycinase [Pirellulaceae bacterium]|jgi:cyanophycinase|nr:cyanophycinase [Pirellulaceae bacterium]MDP7018686.1 cyanophycinase [Pirellulaceae bacterium]
MTSHFSPEFPVRRWQLFLLIVAATVNTARADSNWIDPTGAKGALFIAGGGALSDETLRPFIELAGGADAKLVVIPTASAKADEDGADERYADPWLGRKLGAVTVLHTRDRERANDPDFAAPLKAATAVWFVGGQQSRIAEAYVGTLVEKELMELQKRGGVIGGTSAGAAIQSKLMIARGNPEAELKVGFDLLPGAVVDQHFTKRKRAPRLRGVLAKHPLHVGVGVDEQTALVVRGRRMRVAGEGNVRLLFAPSEREEATEIVLEPRQFGDWTSMRRLARDRAGDLFPAAKAVTPVVENGSLVIVGGGGMPDELTDRFIELAGGEESLIVVLPTAVPDPLPPDERIARLFTRRGAKNVKVLRARAKEEVESAASLKLLREATGVWFGGGRQWRFLDAYENTKLEPLLHDVLKRGGVIGGSSAGASIQAEFLVRGSPLGNRTMMADGYVRGLGFLPGVAIDQHFAQRKRFRDMTAVMKRHPQLLGIGIDETTALVVKGSIAEIVGANKVHFYNHRQPVEDGKPDYETVDAGRRYDLAARRIVEP